MYISADGKTQLTKRQYTTKLKQGSIDPGDWEEIKIKYENSLEVWRKIKELTLVEVVQEMENVVGVHYSWQYFRDLEKGNRKPSYDFIREFRFVFDESSEIFFDPDAYGIRG